MGKLAPKDIENILSLTPLQEGMLFHYLQNPQSPFYFEQLSLEISGVIDHKLFEEAWNVVIKTNEMLRVVFRWDKVDNPVQIVLKEHEFQPRYIDIPGTDTGERKERLEQIKQKDAQEKFDLQEVPFRVTLCKIEKDKYVMILSNHHILYDGWSNGIILKEFFKVYHKLRHGKGSRKVPIKPSFNEFIKWSQNQDKNKQQQFWREYLAGIETPTVLPIKRKIEETVRAADYSIILEENIRFKLDFFTKEYRVTLASVFYTTWGILLRKYCGSEDVIFGATVSGRTAEIKGIEEMVGLFINTIPLRTQTIPREKICDVVFRTDQALREREEFENTPLVDIQGYSPLGSGGALFDIIVAIENYPLDNRLAPDGQGADSSLSVHSYSMAEMTHYDLTVGIMLFNEIEIKFSFKPGLFEEEIIENLAGHFKGIIRTMIENPGMELSQLEIISGDEKNRILYEFTNTKVEYPANKTIHQLFEEQVEQSPDRIAIFGRGRTLSWTNTDIIVGAGSQTCPMVLSYRQLNEQSNRLAGLLVEKGVLADNIVGIMMERSVEMIVGIIGILKSGGAYLPIDPGYPQERIDFMLKDSAAKILLTAAECVFNFHHSSFIIHHSSHSSHLAYIIYTSGTTGKPKGVIVEHGSIFNTIYWRRQEYNLSAADRSLQLFSFAFDGFLTSFFTPVVSGTPVVLLSDDEAKDITRIKEIIISEKITHFICVPSLYRWLLGASTGKELSRLKVVTLAGEQVTPDLVEKSKQLNPLLEIVNEYGPTESSVLASINRDIQPGATISIGKPIANSGIYIIDKDEKLSPIGIPGQLVIFGKGLARGYLNNPELTSQKFNRSYRSYKTYINYKTGDIARFLSDGKIEFLGRIDQQVKIRGFRIEPGEIETLLLKHDRIKDAAIVVKGDETGDQNLAAYFVSDAALSDSELREYLLKDMPEYMIPSYFVRLEKIPLTSSGKLDRGALPNPKVKEIAAYTAPRNVIEMKLVDIWAGIFDRNISPDRISIDDNFFRLGGHSLKATILVSKIHKVFDVKVPLTEIFKNPTIRGLSRYIENAVGDRYIRTAPVEKKEYYVLSSAQKRLFFLQQMELDSTGYNITSVMTLEGELDKEKFEKTFNKLIARHESLRTSFEFIDKEPVQRIHDHVEFEIEYKNSSTDYTDYTDGRGDATLPLWSPFIRPFDLSKAPLLRVGLARLEEKRHLWMVDMHHIICDGTSMGILVKDFMALYEGKELPSLKIHYKDYAEWQSNDKNREFLDSQEKFWLGQYADEIPVLNLPADFPRPLVQSFEGNHEPFELTMEETSSLKTLAMEQGITLYMLLLAICNTWFSKLSGEEDVVIGTPVAGRRHDEHQDIVGMFVNTLALRNYPAAAITFTDFLMEIKERTVEAFQNQDYPFETLVDQVVKDRDTSRNPLFDVMFVFQNMDVPEIEIPGLILKPYEFENKTSKFDLNLDGMEKDGKLLFNLEYSTKLFKKETALRFNNYFKNIINSIIRRPGMRIADIEIMGKEEKERILEISNGVEEYVDLNETVHGMFEKVAAGNEDKTALVFGKGRITYGELNRVANRLARILRTQGVGSDNNVGLMVERSFELVIGMLAIMKAGGAYLPIDPKFPPQRKRFMMEDSHMTTLLTNYEINGAADYIPGSIGIVDMRDNSIYRDIAGGAEEELQNTNKGSDLVYVIFTSGSTGKPKGVMLEHTNLVNLIKFHHKYTGIDCTKVLQFATISFDASFHEIFSCLLAGGELYLVDEGTKNNIPLLFEFIAKNKIRTLFMPMAILRLIFSHDEYINTFPASVTHIQTAGEQVIVDDKFRNHLKEAKIYLHNHYGPSETHVVTVLTMTPQGYIPEFPSIGTPVMNTGIYILDKEKHLLPMGVVGELYAGGLQVGRGYLNNPELTVEKFDQDLWDYRDDRDEKNKSFAGDQGPAARGAYKELFQKHPLVYNTGDLARWLPNGDVEFLGRIDHQVKIRGIRVEPGEIENHLKKIEFVKDAIVMVKQEANREKYLCAYIVLHPGIELDISKLRNSLAEELPDYMIPAYFVPLDKIPLTPIGKLDRHSLPEPEIIKEEKTYVAPRNSIEEALVEIWSEALGIGKQTISIRDNFFYLGGHSLKAALLAARIHRKFNVNIPLLEIFRAPVLKDLAQYIEKKADPYKYISIESAEKREYYVLSSAQKRLYVIQQMDPDSTVYNIPAVMTLIGELDSVKFEGIFKKLIHRHESLRTSFHMLNEEPVQRIHDEVKFEIEYFDLATKDAKRHEENQIHHSSFIIHHYIQSFVRPFDLSKAPLLRVGLVKLEEEEHILLVDMNHIISDGISIGIMVNEFMTLIAGEDPEPLRIQYRDWAQWQDHEKNSERVKKQEAYWLKEFEGKIPVLNLPYDYTSPTVQDFVGKRVNFALSNNETESLNKLARQEEVTLYMLLISAYYTLLYKLTDREDIIIGAPTAGRFQEELQKIIGMFLNTLALRNFPGGNKPFKLFLKDVKTKVLNAFENQDYQFDDLVDRLELKRGDGRNPLFDVMFILQNLEKPEIHIPGLAIKNVELENPTTKFDLSLYAEEIGHDLSFGITFREKLFTQATIALIIDYFKVILSSVIKNPGQPLAEINIISEERRTAMLSQLNQDLQHEAAPIMEDCIFQTRLQQSLLKYQDNIALEYGGSSLSYAELDRRSDVVCRWILNKGIAGHTFIGMLINHRLQLIITLLGIIKSGCVIVPLYPGYPTERLEEMIQVTGLRYMFIDQDNARRFKQNPDVEFIDPACFDFDAEGEKGIEDNKRMALYNPEDPLYIHFTSGSTGEPKATLGKNRGLLHFISWEITTLGITPGFHAAQFTIPGFDPFLRDVFAPLLAGGVVCIPANEDIVRHAAQLAYYVEQRRINLIHCVTGLFRLMISSAPPPTYFRNLKYILLAGEKTNPSDLVEWYDTFGERVQLLNCYGPTETTMSKAYYPITPADIKRERIPVGKPLPGARIIILDENRNMCAPLTPGEICIRTPFGSCGYFNAPGLNREKFIVNPFGTDHGDLIYRSGDLGRILADGNLDILGRTDRQIKIRGYRVEPGDIEHHLLKHPEIKDALVLPLGDDSKDSYLCAYIIPRRPFTVSELREYLAQKLPDYMIPAYFVTMERFPLTARGKIDRNSLPEPGIEVEENIIAPANETEKKLLKIWAEVLRKDESKISVEANFIDLGGHSLKAATLAAKIHKEFNVNVPLADFFKALTIRGLSQYIKGTAKEQHLEIEPVEKKWFYPLSSAQKRLYFLQVMEGNGITYNMPRMMKLEGKIDPERLTHVFNRLIQRHESLRTSFHMVDEEPVQRVLGVRGQESGDSEEKNLTKVFGPTFFQKGGLSKDFIKEFIRPFDLSKAPLLRLGLVKLAEEEHLLLVDMHHIISDGVSIDVLVQDFSSLYSGKELPEMKLQYKDYAEWQNRERGSKKILAQGEYWKKEYEGEIPVLELPTDYARPDVQAFDGERVNFEVSSETSGILKAMALETGATLYIVLLALYSIFLAKLSSREDIVIGSPVAGRRHSDLEKIIGMFVNTLALRVYPAGEKNFSYFLQEVKEKTLKDLENQEYQYEDLVEEVAVTRDLSRNPLFDTMFALQNTGTQKFDIPGLTLLPCEYENKTAKFDLILNGLETEGKLLFTLDYCTKLFKRETIERFITYFINIIHGAVENKHRRISDFEIITAEEKERLLYDFNNTYVEYPKDKTIHRLFEEQVEQNPDRIALVGATAVETLRATSLQISPTYLQITYRQLNEQSDRLAGVLIEKGVLPDTIVGLMMERSVEMIIGILGILKSCGAYLPIDPDYPQERIDYMLKDSGAKLLVNEKFFGGPGGDFSKKPPARRGHFRYSNHLAYIIYTSGSTGRPKGVLVQHRSAVNLICNQDNFFKINKSDRILQFSTICFDASVEQIFTALSSGAVLVLIDKSTLLDVDKFEKFVFRHQVTHIHAVPSFLNGIHLRHAPQLKRVVSGGDICPISLAEKWGRNCDFYNKYGPTETTVTSIEKLIKDTNTFASRLSIGKPIGNTIIYLLDRFRKPVPLGVIGELYIGGEGIARGYMNRPELTAERFILTRGAFEKAPLAPPKLLIINHSPFTTHHSPLYKTGDLARWLSNGNIDFLGRIDNQVKIRGFRVELGEIENRILKHTGIKEAAAVIKEEESGDRYICAYVVSDREYDAAGLRQFLLKELPDHMIPSYFVQIEKMPLTANGKIDRKVLPKPELKAGDNFTAPRNGIERKLAALWSEILGKGTADASQLQTSIGIDDNFFQVGGHSLKATILAAKMHKAFDVKVPLAEIFKRPTIRGLADYINFAAGEKYIRIEPVEKKEYYPLSSAQKRLYFLQVMEETGTAYNLSQVLKLEGKIDVERLKETFVKLIRRHESARTSFHMIDDEPVQRIHDNVEFEIEYFDLAAKDAKRHEENKIHHSSFMNIPNHFIRSFDLSKAPLLRVELVKLEEEKYVLLVDMHHIISDGTSMAVLVKEFMTLYDGRELPQLRLHYKDYAVWEKQRQEEIRKQQDYWLKEFGEFQDEIPVLDLPVDYLRPKVNNFAGSVLNFELDGKLTRALNDLALQHGVTLYMALLAIYNIFLAKISGQEIIVVGTPTAGRHHADLEQVIGMFVNTLALKNAPALEKRFRTFLEEVKENTINAFANQDYPYDKLVEKVVHNRDAGHNPLFDTMFILQNMDSPTMEIPGLKLGPFPYERDTAKFDLTLVCDESDDCISCTLEYSTQLFRRETIQRFANYLENITTAAAWDSEQLLAKINMLTDEEKKQLIMDFNDTAVPYPDNKTIYQLFEEQVDQFPDHPALVFENHCLTFRHFDERANQLAKYLRHEKQVQVGDRIVVLMDRSIELIIVLMGVMKARCAYVPMDVSLPAERLRIVFNDASIEVVASQQKYLPMIAGVQAECRGLRSILCMDVLQKAINGYPASRPTGGDIGDVDDAAYVMYTSGSSGIPKGVLVKHRTIVNTIIWRKNNYEYAAGHVSLQVPPYFFDSSVTDIFTPLLGGARLVLIRDEERTDLAALRRIIVSQGVSHFIVVPIFYNIMLEEIAADLKYIKMICCAGDNFSDELIRKHFERLPHVRIFNEYGPTENSVNSTAYELKSHSTRALIGRPCNNIAVYILDRYQCLTPIGVTGELCLAGSSLAVGYLN
ncbi:MAG: tyrocidine synthetase, partial [Acidobacteriota bacterium]|nr:tyrocidine synthetase [Acidobacteriota bacterium]